uniref:Ig-like domain-containing protein n=1 Tax=Nothobranchius furzeri TaxID=105023 RepID=A0A8C6KFM2_NOTFU
MIQDVICFNLLLAVSLLSAVAETFKGPKQITLTEAASGDMVTLTCDVSGHEKGLFNWYKLSYRYMEQILAHSTLGSVEKQDLFQGSYLIKKEHDVYSLTIKNISIEDEATYFCQTGPAYKLTFVNATHLVVIGSQTMKSISVNQTLQCSLYSEREEKSDRCGDEHSVLWFKAGPKSDSGFIYTNKISCAGRSCIYRLSKPIQNSLDTGTYYCAVVACGQILFGEGIQVKTKLVYLFLILGPGVCPFVIVLGLMLGCSILLNFIFILLRKSKQIPDKGNIVMKQFVQILKTLYQY